METAPHKHGGQLTPHFHLAEFTASETALRRGIDNTPPQHVVERLCEVALVLENIRFFLKAPIIITSGYRSPKLNRAVRGARGSHHMDGYAVDFIAPLYGDHVRVAHRCWASLYQRWDQLILEPGWVHLSLHPRLRGDFIDMRTGEVRTRGDGLGAVWEDTRAIGEGFAQQSHEQPSGGSGE